MKLNYRKMGGGDPVIILHGLFGSSDNWQTIGKVLAEDYEVYLVDQRNHGKSPHSDEFSYQLMAEDLLEFIRDHQITGCYLIGHSMGGKTVMTYAQQWEESVYKMIVADMGVKGYPPHHVDVLAAFNAVDFSIHNTRKKVEEVVSSFVQRESVVQFLLKNLHWVSKGQLAWRMNVPVLEKSMPPILEAIPKKTCHTQTLFLSGGASDYVVDGDQEEIKSIFPNAEFQVIPDAGHWLHSEKPETFLQAISVYMDA